MCIIFSENMEGLPLPGKLGLSETEYMIMSYLWKRKGEVFLRDVVNHFTEEGHPWASQTVKTFLDNLVRKGALAFRWQGHQKVYFPSSDHTAFATKWIREMIRQNFNSMDDYITAFCDVKEDLTNEQKEELRRMLDE